MNYVLKAADPVCEIRRGAVVIENNVFEICCMLSNTGSLLPAMKWRMANGSNKLKERALNVTSATSKTDAISTLTMVADYTLDGSRYICETVFEVSSQKSNPKVSNNTPSYNYTWMSSYIQVLCKLRFIFSAYNLY